MRSSTTLARSPYFVVHAVSCTDDHTGWSEPEKQALTQVVLVRRGRFRLRSQGSLLNVDPTAGYLHVPGQEQQFSHPHGGDVCTSVTLTTDVLADGPWQGAGPVRVDGRLELAHRLLRRSADDMAFGAAEALVDLIGLALRDRPDAAPPGPGRRELAERAREAITSGDPAGTDLVGLARSLDTSPSHLSRTFRHHVGMTVSRYRNRVRVSRSLSRIEDGDGDLAALAADLGFSDQAHLSRVIKTELGHTPGQVRRLLLSDNR
ncbi:MAG: helix-turn-helix domain-containing protein [Actinoallomurus sp.]